MKTIWKYKLEAKEIQIIQMPNGARLLTVAVQDEEIYLWALVDTDKPLEGRRFCIYGTGHEVKEWENSSYIGTAFLEYSSVLRLIFHVFERYEE